MLAAAMLAGCGESTPVTGVATPPANAPNIVLVMTDDQAVEDLRALPLVRDSIGGEGVTFPNAFVSWPLCCPSRATAFTGQYAHNHQVLGNYPPDGSYLAFQDESETLPVWLARAGYATIHVGKYLNGYGGDDRGQTHVPPGWSHWRGLVDPSTYSMWGYTVNRDGTLITYGEPDVEDPALYQTDVLRDLALEAIGDLAASGQPFFLSVAFLAPHEEIGELGAGREFPGPRPAPRHAGSHAGTPLPTPPNFDEADLSDKPQAAIAYAGRYEETIEQRTSRYQRRLESLRAVDEAVQAIIDRLDQLGELDNTYLVFTADNGWFNGEHHIELGKHLMYEPSIRVPLLVRGPGIPAGVVSEELIANVDLAATFAAVVDVAAGRIVDGRSLLPYAQDPQLRSARPVLLDAPHEQVVRGSRDGADTIVEVPPLLGLRTTRYAYVEYGSGDVELYDLLIDPYQLESRHTDPAYQALRAQLHEALTQYQGCAGDSCRADLVLTP
jgi:N-acetylglucosamine-6-sulfatase